ncbi:hypothetical protein SK571_13635 [Lentzea sp. BCCO 10_0798]|uniref:Excreted virulence factor EspC, type VII ESX diderm n=1 Tax=Lentzea kristufekii TaxID=3095430 RepID=A0ABU4TQQ3_9PSEU|nr:hypothetical protein [Lentzea sp. BCCO 10_0798]MDX8050428.1 hypothetical protein [Lentzea sp. BCCO 10_0798]
MSPLRRDLAGDVLADIMRVTSAATPGPWRMAGSGYGYSLGGKVHESVFAPREGGDPVFIALTGLCGEAQSQADAAFIASAREAMPWLVDEVNRLRAARMRGWDTALDSAQHAEHLDAEVERLRARVDELAAENEQLRGEAGNRGRVVNLGIGHRGVSR